MTSICLKCVSNSIPESSSMGNWKYVRNTVARVLNVPCEAEGYSTYHFVAGLIKVR